MSEVYLMTIEVVNSRKSTAQPGKDALFGRHTNRIVSLIIAKYSMTMAPTPARKKTATMLDTVNQR